MGSRPPQESPQQHLDRGQLGCTTHSRLRSSGFPEAAGSCAWSRPTRSQVRFLLRPGGEVGRRGAGQCGSDHIAPADACAWICHLSPARTSRRTSVTLTAVPGRGAPPVRRTAPACAARRDPWRAAGTGGQCHPADTSTPRSPAHRRRQSQGVRGRRRSRRRNASSSTTWRGHASSCSLSSWPSPSASGSRAVSRVLD
jgi:hypothetical protein